MKKIISMILVLTLISSVFICSFIISASAEGTMTYSFTGSDADKAGYAEGTVSLSGKNGNKYTFFWADSNSALAGYKEIATVTAASGKANYTFSSNVSIPKDARYIIAIENMTSSSSKNVSNAYASYKLPDNKIIGNDLSYSFAAFSDIHIDEPGANYPYDEDHLKMAFDVADKRKVDFVITSGDHINNAGWDNGGNRYNMFWMNEYNTYEKILAESTYSGPVYEAIGNHELWNGDTESGPKKDQAGHTQYNYFIRTTGLDSNLSTIGQKKAYYEITEPKTGDHFIFLALEGGFYTDRVNEFTDTQLEWLSGKLNAYKNDGKNVYIIEHANFYRWGAGDLLDTPLYDIPLKDSMSSTVKLKSILCNYKNAVVITGHTHFQFSDVPDLNNNNNSSAYIMHNSSVGGVRKIVNKQRVNAHDKRELCQGYLVNVYGNARVFNGTDLYTNEIIPAYSYIVGKATPYQPVTEVTETETTTEPVPTILYGDADCDSRVSINDALTIQLSLVSLCTLSEQGKINARVDGKDSVTITDATLIQQKLANIIEKFPVEEPKEKKEVAVIGADQSSAQIKQYLSKQYIYASYDQYQACKKAVQQYETGQISLSDLNNKYNELKTLVSKLGELSDTCTVYFTKPGDWSTPSIYLWKNGGEMAWPGKSMTYVGTNSYGETIYSYTFNKSSYANFLFNDGKQSGTIQTRDIKVLDTFNPQYFVTYKDSDGKYYFGITQYNLSLNY